MRVSPREGAWGAVTRSSAFAFSVGEESTGPTAMRCQPTRSLRTQQSPQSRKVKKYVWRDEKGRALKIWKRTPALAKTRSSGTWGKEPSTGTLKLLNYCSKFSNTSRMYLYWQVDRKAIICTLTNDFNSEGGFLKWLPCSFRYHSFISPSEERACGCPHDPLILIWKSSLLQVFLASQFQKGLAALPSQSPVSQVWSFFDGLTAINCHTHIHTFCGLGKPALMKLIPWQSNFSSRCPGSPFGHHQGL